MDFKEAHLRTITLLSCDRRNLLHPHSLIPHPQSSIEKGRVLTQFFSWTPPPPESASSTAECYPGRIPFSNFGTPLYSCSVNFKRKTKITDIQEIPVSPHLLSKLSLQIYTHFKSQNTCTPPPVFPKTRLKTHVNIIPIPKIK